MDRVNYYTKIVIDAVVTRLSMDDYFDSFSNKEEAINVHKSQKIIIKWRI